MEMVFNVFKEKELGNLQPIVGKRLRNWKNKSNRQTRLLLERGPVYQLLPDFIMRENVLKSTLEILQIDIIL